MNILAVDPGTKMGWATFHKEFIPAGNDYFMKRESGVKSFATNKGDSPGVRFIMFKNWLKAIIAEKEIDIVIYEMPYSIGIYAQRVMYIFVGTIWTTCEEHSIQFKEVHPGTLKKFATGSGRATKDEMMKACAEKLDKKAFDHNEADALWLLEYGKTKFRIKQ